MKINAMVVIGKTFHVKFSLRSQFILGSQSYLKRKLIENSANFQREKIRIARKVRIIRIVRINPII
jgi:hypothetical protein